MTGDPMTAADRVQPILDAVAADAQRASRRDGSTSSATARRTSGSTTPSARTSSAPSGPPCRWRSASCSSPSARSWPPCCRSASRSPRSWPPTACWPWSATGCTWTRSASSVMLLIGLAVGVDYCMFYLRREREERAQGPDPETALRIAAATSGRSVLVSGLTVVVAMSGMFLSGMLLFDGLRRRRDPRRAGRRRRLGDRAAGAAVAARRPGRLRPGARAGPDAAPERWQQGLGRDPRPGPEARPGSRCSPRVALPARAGRRRSLGIHTEQLSLDKLLPADASIMQSYHRITTAFPGGPSPAARGGQGRRRRQPGDDGRRDGLPHRRRWRPVWCTSRSRSRRTRRRA